MSISKHIEDIQAGIKAGRYSNEASVSQGIVLRLLQALGWPTYETQIVCPEYSLSGRRVDYALCHPTSKPVAFIEVKQIGQSDGAERQLFEYAFHVGVPLAILTDGQEWNFFLPAEQGNYAERRVYKLDIVERDIAESASRLQRYLGYPQVTSGAALAAARQDYQDVSRSRQMISALPEAWSKLVTEEDEVLLELLADKVENLCGFKPDVDTVARFLRDTVARHSPSLPAKSPRPSSPPTATTRENTARVLPTAVTSSPTSTRSTGFTLKGQFIPCRNGRDVLVEVFEMLDQRDPTFLTRFAARPKHGRTRRYLAQTPEELYPNSPHLARDHFHKLRSGWCVATNVSHSGIERIIKMACDVSQINFGQDLITHISD